MISSFFEAVREGGGEGRGGNGGRGERIKLQLTLAAVNEFLYIFSNLCELLE